MKCYEIAILATNNTWHSATGIVNDDIFGESVISQHIEDHKDYFEAFSDEIAGFCLLYLGNPEETETVC